MRDRWVPTSHWEAKPGAPFLLLFLLALLAIPACARPPADATVETPPTAANPTQSLPLATPVAQQPAAGICGATENDVVVVTIYPDIPDPRCVKVTPGQSLKVVNGTEGSVQVVLGPFYAALQPGEEYTFDLPLGEYLAPGVHLVQVLPCCGPELWLAEKSE